jgi:phenylacetic acid degradation operon negative regulatory protein
MVKLQLPVRWTTRSALGLVLAEYLWRESRQSMWVSTAIEALTALGFEEAAVRQALFRMVKDHTLIFHRQPRRARLSYDPRQTPLVEAAERRFDDFSPTLPSWDGRWLVVALAPSASARRLTGMRYRLADRLRWAGLGQPIPGLWVGPDVRRQPAVRVVLDDLQLSDTSYMFVSKLGEVGDPAGLVAASWDLAFLAAAYQQFIDTFSSSKARTDQEAFVFWIKMLHEWRGFPLCDPGLPAELLPRQWCGMHASQLFISSAARWRPRATRWLDQLETSD